MDEISEAQRYIIIRIITKLKIKITEYSHYAIKMSNNVYKYIPP